MTAITVPGDQGVRRRSSCRPGAAADLCPGAKIYVEAWVLDTMRTVDQPGTSSSRTARPSHLQAVSATSTSSRFSVTR